MVSIFWNNMRGQRIVRDFLCFPSFQKLNNLNPKEKGKKWKIITFHLRKTVTKELQHIKGMSSTFSLGCPVEIDSTLFLANATHLSPDFLRLATLLRFDDSSWSFTSKILQTGAEIWNVSTFFQNIQSSRTVFFLGRLGTLSPQHLIFHMLASEASEYTWHKEKKSNLTQCVAMKATEKQVEKEKKRRKKPNTIWTWEGPKSKISHNHCPEKWRF